MQISNYETIFKTIIINHAKTLSNYKKLSYTCLDNNVFYIDIMGENKSLRLKDNNKLNKTYGIAFVFDYFKVFENSYSQNDNLLCFNKLVCFFKYFAELPQNFLIRIIYQPNKTSDFSKQLVYDLCYKYNILNNINEVYCICFYNQFSKNYISNIKCYNNQIYCEFSILIKGKGGHGSAPDLCNSPITTGSEIIIKLNQITSQNISNSKKCCLFVTSFNCGEAYNAIPDTGVIKGYINACDNLILSEIKQCIESISNCISLSNKCTVEFNYKNKNVTNDFNSLNDELFDDVFEKHAKMTNSKIIKNNVSELNDHYYSSYLSNKSGALILIGVGDETIQKLDKYYQIYYLNQFTLYKGILENVVSLNYISN